MNRKMIFVDTWAWYALSNRKDKDHELAVELNKKYISEGFHYITTNFIFSETYTLIIVRGKDHKADIKFDEKLKAMSENRTISYIRITEAIEDTAWEIANQYDDKDFSYVDCTSFAIMKKLGISVAFTDDDHFKQIGFHIAK